MFGSKTATVRSRTGRTTGRESGAARADRSADRDGVQNTHDRRGRTRAAHARLQSTSGPYADWLRPVIAEGLRSTGALPPAPADDLLASLADALCERRDLRSLALLLPALLGDLGTPDDRVRLVTALHMLHASRTLPSDEQAAVGRAATALS